MSTAPKQTVTANAAETEATPTAIIEMESSSIPVSFAQRRLWFLDKLEPDSPLYNLPTVLRITGPLGANTLQRAIDEVVSRHEILRTRILSIEETPSQIIEEKAAVTIKCLDLSQGSDPETEAKRSVLKESECPFDLSKAPLLRAMLVKLGREEHLLVVTMHHIISDEWSLKIFFRELAEFYCAFQKARPVQLAPLPIQYADYAIWQRERLHDPSLRKQLQYWTQKLQGHPTPVELPTDHPRGLRPSFRGESASRTLSRDLGDCLKKLAQSEAATLFMVLLAAFKALVYRYTEREDLIVGTAIAGRGQMETETLIGLFVNTLALRTRIEGGMTFHEVLQRVRETTLEAYAHQDVPFETIVEKLHPERTLNHLPFTRVMFVLQQEILEEMDWEGLKVRLEETETNTSKFELTMVVQETRKGLRLFAEYDAALFEQATVARLLHHFEILLQGLVAHPEQHLAELPLLSPAERQQMVIDWNQTTTDYPREKCIHQIFEAQTRRAPAATAVVFGQQFLTYQELNARANQLAHFLRQYQIGPDIPVAICLSRSSEMIIGLLAILKAGGAYVPLDLTYPKDRLESMLADSQASVLLTEQRALPYLPRHVAQVLCLDSDWDLIAREPRGNLTSAATAESLAYIMYTSGSTGQPKGVAVPHRAVNRLVLNTNYVRLDATDKIAQVSNISFDAATFEIWGALLNGGQLIGITTDVALSPRDFASELREQGITGMFLTAALFNQLAAEVPGAFATLRTLIAGGEALDPRWTRAALKQGKPQQLLNGYGPTENTTFSCCYTIPDVPENATNVPIGKPIANSTAYILDRHLNPVPIGVPGDLYVGGDGLARGYWNQPQCTAKHFIPHPFQAKAQLYQTGDVARFLPDGNIEFLGRKDGQVKIRGFRIELGEIETILAQHPAVRECVAAVNRNGTGQNRLIAYYVLNGGNSPNGSDLRRFLSEKLPAHMVPALFLRLDALPLNANGKVDRHALPKPDQARPELEKKYASPRDAVELELTGIWERTLGVHPIGIEDKFFDLGGHSLLAVRVVAQIERAFGKKVGVATLFQAPTIAQLALFLREETRPQSAAAATSVVEIQSKGAGPPLFLVHGAGGGMFWGYVNLARRLGLDQPVYGFRSRGLDGKPEFERVEEMAAQYIADMRLVQPKGPYHLGGYCFGGNVAFEMARQLSAQGEALGLLALINCAPPNSRYGQPTWTPIWFARLFCNLRYWIDCSRHWTSSQRRDFLRWKMQLFRKNLTSFARFSRSELSRLDVENMVDLSSFSPEQQRLWEVHIRAQLNYQPKPFAGRVHLLRSPGHPFWCSFDPKYGWSDYAQGGVDVIVVPAAHEKILEEPFVKLVAAELRNRLQPKEVPQEEPSALLKSSPASLQPPSSEEPRPLTFGQQRLWFLNQLETDNAAAFQKVAAVRLEGSLNQQALETAMDQILERHRILRSVFPAQGGRPFTVSTHQKLTIQEWDLQNDSVAEHPDRFHKIIQQERQRRFDPAVDIPIRASLIKYGPNENVLVLILHEIAADSASIPVLFRDLAFLYGSLVQPETRIHSVPTPASQFCDFAASQFAEAEQGAWDEPLRFWRQQLAGAPALLELPLDHSRPATQSYRARSETCALPLSLPTELERLCLRLGADYFELLLATVHVLLKRYIRQEEIVLATPVKNRETQQHMEAVGPFENLLVLRTGLPDDPSFTELLARVRQTVATAKDHRSVPFEKLLQEIRPPRDHSYHPLAQVLFAFVEKPKFVADSGGLRMSVLDLDEAATQFDLRLECVQNRSGMELRATFAADLFEPATIQRLLGHWQRLLEGIVADPQGHISALPLLTTAETRTLLAEWTATEQDFPREKTLFELFAEQSGRTPDATAIVSGNQRFTYRELEERAVRISSQLHALGVGNQMLVGVCLERSWEMVAAILGTLRAGAAYVPMDPAYPQERLGFMAQDAKMRVILTQRKLLELLPGSATSILCLEDIDWAGQKDIGRSSVEESKRPRIDSNYSGPGFHAPRASDLAYVIYTSGSTGQPKGVALEHRAAVAFVSWARSVFTREELDGVLASTSVCFDLSVFEMFVPLCNGGKVILAENALALATLPAANEVRLINTVPSAMSELLRAKAVPSSVRVVNLAGEPLSTPLVNKIYSETAVRKVYDLYGPTETTTYSTFTLRKPDKPASIGRPLANEQVYLLDAQSQLVPIGVTGELYIGGVGLAREYLNRPDLTAQKFVPHPFRPGERLYRTGDLARWRPDGQLEYLGRIDHQVKIRGFRIELGEVEAALKKQTGVREAVVLAREDMPGNKRLVAYVVLGQSEELAAAIHAETKASLTQPASDQPALLLNPDELRRGLRQLLPEYMVPSIFVCLQALPLTPNGKVDRKALPAPEMDPERPRHVVEAPLTPLHRQLVDIWRDVLHVQQIGINDNFFDLGGHSLLAFQIISRLRESFSVELPLSSLFETPTVAALAEGLEAGRWQRTGDPVPRLEPLSGTGNLPVSFVQERLWFLDQLLPGGHAYNVAQALGLKGRLNVPALQQAFDQVISRHDALRTTFHYFGDNLTQVVAPHGDIKLRVIELGGTAGASSSSSARIDPRLFPLLNAEAQRPFDLSRGPLLRATLFRLSATEHALLLVLHHIISDGWSLAILFRELATAYDACASGQVMKESAPLPIQYADFAHWQRKWIQGRMLERELDYWRNALQGAPARLELPTDCDPLGQGTGKAARARLPLPKGVNAAMLRLSQTLGATPFIVLLSALAITLRKWTGQTDMVIGTVVAGRHRKEIENVIGCFMNFLPLRLKVTDGESAEQFLERVKGTVLEAHGHQDCPFEKVVEALNPERKLNQNPLYNVALLLQNFPEQVFQTDTIQSFPIPVALEAALLDLRFEVEQTAEGFKLDCEYNTDLFEHETITQLLSSFRAAVEQLTLTHEPNLTEIKLTPALEAQSRLRRGKEQHSIAVAATFTAEPLQETLEFWLKKLKLPGGIRFAPFNQVFQQLLDPSGLLSTNERGINVLLVRLEDWQDSDTPGGGALSSDNLERSVNDFILALKTAWARHSTPYLVSLCPPSARVTAEPDAAKHLVRVERRIAAELENVAGVYIVRPEDIFRWYPVPEYYDASAEELGGVPYTPLFYNALGTLIARKFHRLTRAAYKVIVLDCDNTLWCGVCGEEGASGIRLEQPWCALQQFMRAQHDDGMLLCLCSKNNEEDALAVFRQRLDMPLRLEQFAAWRLNWLSKPENLRSLAQELNLGLDSFIFIDDNPVECAAVAAECPEVLVLQLPENPEQIPQFLNHCWAFDQLKVTAEDRNRTEMYRQNYQREKLRAQSVSLADFLGGLELKIQMEPLAPDQLPRVAQLTQRTNQFNFTSCRRSETELQALARTHEILSVKVRDRFGDYGLVGVIIYRLEQDSLDVDTFLLSCRVLGRGVEHRMLARLGELARDRKLSHVDAHFNPSKKNQPARDFLERVGAPFRQALNGGYLFRFPADAASAVKLDPQQTEAVESVLTGTSAPSSNLPGGTDSQRFMGYRDIAFEACEIEKIHQAIEAKTLVRAHEGNGYVPPRTDFERKLCGLWERLLRIERVGIQDNFFDLGGHSLLAVRLFAEVEKLTGRKFPLVTIFQAPTIEQLEPLLVQSPADPGQSCIVPIQSHGAKPPLFLVHGAGGDVLWGYANLATHLPPDQPVHGIKSRGQAGLEEFTNVHEMATYYLQQMRALQPSGPYFVGGYCFGGNVAYEMARQLEAQGEKVALVALLDSAPANAGYESMRWWRPAFPYRFVRNLYYWLEDFWRLEPKVRIGFVLRKTRAFARKLARRLRGKTGGALADLEEVIDPSLFPEHEQKLWQIHLRALTEHVDQPYKGPVTLFRTRGQPLFCSLEEDFCWRNLAKGGVHIRAVPGSHEGVFVEPNVKALAKALTLALTEAQLPGGDHQRVDIFPLSREKLAETKNIAAT